MEAGMVRAPDRDAAVPLKSPRDFPSEAHPEFVNPEIHAGELEQRRLEAEKAFEFHGVRRDEAQAVIASCDSALATLREIGGNRQPGIR